MQRFAQTNIQLFNQMQAAGYSTEDLERAARGFAVVREIFVGKVRASGKDLTSHLAGTASILVWLGRPADSVIAGMVHAALEDGDFGGRDPEKVIVEAVGRGGYEHLMAYHTLRWSHTSELVQQMLAELPSMDDLTREALVIRLANELEDYLDVAVRYTGRPLQQGEHFRITYMNEAEKPMRELAVAAGVPQLADEITAQFDACRDAVVSPAMRSGHDHMWLQHPASSSPGLGARVMHQVKQTPRRFRKARKLGVKGSVQRAKEMRG